MNSIQSRLRFFIFFSAAFFGVTLFLFLDSLIQWQNFSTNIQDSLTLENYLKSNKLRKKNVKNLVKWRKSLDSISRKENLSSIIQAINSKQYNSLSKKLEVYLKNEKEYRKTLHEKLTAKKNKILIYLYSFISCFFVVTFFISIYIQRKIFSPLNRLYMRMFDFLNDRYTYEFQTPEANEVGGLQSTFNSLAQRVISNIEELKTLDSAKTEFLNIASHELRTPLTSIKGSLSLLKNGVGQNLNKNSNKLLSIAENETDRLIRLITDLLDLAKIESKKLTLSQEWIGIEMILKETIDSLEGLCETAKVKINVKGNLAIEIFADQDRIHQVLTNLLSNAIKYSPNGSFVTINYSIDLSHQLVIEVTDQGAGIASEDQKQIFEKFRQATNDKNPLVKGTGLGLAIASAIVQEHEGGIGVKSELQKGSTFYFTLPKWKYTKQQNEGAAA